MIICCDYIKMFIAYVLEQVTIEEEVLSVFNLSALSLMFLRRWGNLVLCEYFIFVFG